MRRSRMVNSTHNSTGTEAKSIEEQKIDSKSSAIINLETRLKTDILQHLMKLSKNPTAFSIWVNDVDRYETELHDEFCRGS